MQLSVPSCLLRDEKHVESSSRLEPVTKLQILQLAVRCYSRAIHGSSADSCSSLWQQLGLAFGSLARLECGQGHEVRAMRALKQTVQLTAGQEHTVWTALGVVAAQQEDWALAQHALIK